MCLGFVLVVALRSVELAAVLNKVAPGLLLACFAQALVGSVSLVPNRGGCCGGADPKMAFVPWFRRRGDEHSGVTAEPWGLYRSAALVELLLQLQVRSRLSSSLTTRVGGEDRVSVRRRSLLPLLCRYVETEADDFPSAMTPATQNKVQPAPGGSGGGGAAARPRPASEVCWCRLPRDPCVISFLLGGELYCKLIF